MTLDGRRTFQQPATSVIDILDRVLDKGLVVAGDISISLANVELLTIRVRLLVCSIDKAQQIGLNWWQYDRNLVAPATAAAVAGAEDMATLEKRIAQLERQVGGTTRKTATSKRTSPRKT